MRCWYLLYIFASSNPSPYANPKCILLACRCILLLDRQLKCHWESALEVLTAGFWHALAVSGMLLKCQWEYHWECDTSAMEVLTAQLMII